MEYRADARLSASGVPSAKQIGLGVRARLPQRQVVIDEQREGHGTKPPLQRAQADVGADQHLGRRRLRCRACSGAPRLGPSIKFVVQWSPRSHVGTHSR